MSGCYRRLGICLYHLLLLLISNDLACDYHVVRLTSTGEEDMKLACAKASMDRMGDAHTHHMVRLTSEEENVKLACVKA